MEMEKQGHQFFKENAQKMTLPSAKEMFEKLAEVELDHYHFLEDQVNHMVSNNEVKEVEMDINRENNIFEERATKEMLEHTLSESMVPDLTVLRSAYLMEKDFAEFYHDAALKAEEPKVKKLFTTLATWEEGHERFFKEEYDRHMKEYMYQPWGG